MFLVAAGLLLALELPMRGAEAEEVHVKAKKRILFVAESVTLAQVVRLVTLARRLDPEAYDVHFASSDFPPLIFRGAGFVQHRLKTLAPAAADAALRSGRRLYEKGTLLEYIDAEVRLIEAIRPDIVVGDFRLTLSTSAELVGVPSAALINAYWSPFAPDRDFPVPDHPVIRWLGEELTERHFPRALPTVFRHFASPLDAARKHHGLPAVGSLLEMLTHASYVLYPDDPCLTPVVGAPATHVYLGPVSWQPEAEAVEVLDEPEPGDQRPLVYVTLGSSGDVTLLPLVVDVLSRRSVRVVVATAGRAELRDVSPNICVRRFVRGADVARRARVVFSNGGSSTGYQALLEGTPVIGLPSNLDQYLATRAIVRAGAGLQIKARRATRELLEESLERALSDGGLQQATRSVAARFRAHDACAAFRRWLDGVLQPGAASAANPNAGSTAPGWVLGSGGQPA